MTNRKHDTKKACGVLLLLGMLAASTCIKAQQVTTFPFEQSFMLDDGNAEFFKTYKDGFYGGSNPPANSAQYVDGVGLMLTDLTGDQGGAVYMQDQKFSSTDGIVIELEYMAYDGTGGDGLSIFLFDASVTDGGNIPRMGAGGAGLGYCYNRSYSGIDEGVDQRKYRAIGLDGAYLGIGLDSYGNFKVKRQQGESRVNGILDGVYGSNGDNNVTLRGAINKDGIGTSYPGMGTGFTGYPVLITQGTMNNKGFILNENITNDDDLYIQHNSYTGDPFTLRGGTIFSEPTDIGYRKAIIKLEPNGDGGYYVTVTIRYNDTENSAPKDAVIINKYNYKKTTTYYENSVMNPYSGSGTGDDVKNNLGYGSSISVTYNTQAPEYFMVGFGASTGTTGAGLHRTDKHVIKHLRVSTPYEPFAGSDSIKNHPSSQDAVFDVFDNDYAYPQTVNESTVPDKTNIDPETFRFIQMTATDTIITPYDPSGSGELCVEDTNASGVKRGDWCYKASTKEVTFKPDASYTFTDGERIEIKYDMTGYYFTSSRSNMADIILEVKMENLSVPLAVDDMIGNHPPTQNAVFDVFDNDKAYQLNNPTPDKAYIDPESFRFIQGTTVTAYDPQTPGELCVDDMINSGSGDVKRGEWCYDPTTKKVTFKSDASYTFVNDETITIKYDMAGTDYPTSRSNQANITLKVTLNPVAVDDLIENHLPSQNAVFDVFDNDKAYQLNNPTPDKDYIDPESFRFIQGTTVTAYDPLAPGELCVDDMINPGTGDVKRGEWCYDPTTKKVTFKPDASYTFANGEAITIKYDMVGTDYPTSRSNQANITLKITVPAIEERYLITNKHITFRLK